MMSTSKLTIAVALAVLAGAALVSADSSANKSFTMKMEDAERAGWETSFNKLIREPFGTKLSCKTGKKMSIDAGEGCVEVGAKKLCCKSFVIELKCDNKNWKQTSIEANNCTEATK